MTRLVPGLCLVVLTGCASLQPRQPLPPDIAMPVAAHQASLTIR